jgi:Tfp pilus assembly protein PilO
VDKNRLWIIGSVLVMVIVVALGWVVGIQPQLAATALADDQRVSVEQTNAGHQIALNKLREDFKGIDKLNQELASLSKSIPSGTNVPDYVDQLDALARANHVTLKGLTVADAQAYTPVPPVAPAVPAAPAGSSAAAAASTPTAAPAPIAAPGSPPVTNANVTAQNFASLSVQITISGTYSDVLRFVNGLQTGTRLFLVSGLSTKAAESSAPVDSKVPTPAAAPAHDRIVDGAISGLIYSIVTPTTPLAVTGG